MELSMRVMLSGMKRVCMTQVAVPSVPAHTLLLLLVLLRVGVFYEGVSHVHLSSTLRHAKMLN